jgi:hypothetical protein
VVTDLSSTAGTAPSQVETPIGIADLTVSPTADAAAQTTAKPTPQTQEPSTTQPGR